MFRKINIYNKLICLILFALSLLLLRKYDFYFIPIILVFVMSLIHQKNKYIFTSLAIFIIYLIIPYSLIFFIISKIILFIVYALILDESLSIREKNYLYNFLNGKKIVDEKKVIERCYKEKIIDDIDFENSLVYKYAIDRDEFKRNSQILKENKKLKLNEELRYKYLIDRIRFGNNDKKAKSKLRIIWTNYDNIFLAVNLFILIIVFSTIWL